MSNPNTDNSSDKVSVFLDGDLQTILSLDSEGYYRGVISLGDDLDSGFHELSISSGNVSDLSSLKISLALSIIALKLRIGKGPIFLFISLVKKILDDAVKLSHLL